MRFEGKVALMTGAASGIGAATARRLAADGARVVLADIDERGLEQVAASIGDSALALPTDVTTPHGNDRMVQSALTSFGRLDAVHLNAGIAHFASIFDCTIEQWDRHMAVNLTGVFLGLQASAPALVQSGGGAVCRPSGNSAGVSVM
jgi:NAD(P)-dependent dehydrogenase (short-subunit alcohol dehydrogenase family)